LRQLSSRFFQSRDIFANLIDHRQLLGERQQSRIGRGVNRPDRSRAGRDQSRIDLVVLGPLPLEPGIGPHLRRLEHHHDKSFAPQLGNNGLLIAATRLDADTLHPMPPKPVRQHLVTLGRVVDLQLLRTAVDRHVELAFAGIDPGTDHGTLGHLRRPFLVCEPSVPSTIRVPMKCRSRSRYNYSPKGFGGHRSDQSAAQSGRPPGLGHSSRNDLSVMLRANTRVGKGALGAVPTIFIQFIAREEMVGTLRFAHPTRAHAAVLSPTVSTPRRI